MKMPSGKAGGYLALSTTSILWGTTWVVSKIGIKSIPAFQMAAMRQFAAGAIFVLYFLLVKKEPLPTRAQFARIILLAFLLFVFANGLSTWGLLFISAGLSALLGALYPLSVVIIERFFYGKKEFNPTMVLGFILGLTGVGLVFYENIIIEMTLKFVLGIILALVAMLSWSIGTISLTNHPLSLNPYYSIGWQMLVSGVGLYLMALLFQPPVPLSAISAQGWMAVLYLVVFGSIVAFIAFIYSLKKLPIAVASLYSYINPLVAMLLGAWLLNERLNMAILWGALLTLAGVFLVNFSLRKKMEKLRDESNV